MDLGRIENKLLDQLQGSNKPLKTKLVDTYEKFHEGNTNTKDLLNLYENVKIFNGKLQDLKVLTDPIKDKLTGTSNSADTENIFFILNDLSAKYTGIIDKFNNITEFVGTNTNRFIKSPEAKWENLLVIYQSFISNYAGILERTKDKNLPEIAGLIDSEINTNISKLDEFIGELKDTQAKLNESIADIMSITEITYSDSDVAWIDASTIKPDKYRILIAYNDISGIIETNGIKLISSLFTNLLEQVKQAQFQSQSKSIDFSDGIDIANKIDELNKPRFKINQFGGDFTNLDHLTKSLYTFGLKLSAANALMGIVENLITGYLDLKMKREHYIIYLMTIKDTIGNKPLKIYKYLDMATIDKYFGILTEITSKKIKYFDIYHWVTVNILMQFFTYLKSDNKFSESKIIDVSNSNGTVYDTLCVFNHFANILDTYADFIANNTHH